MRELTKSRERRVTTEPIGLDDVSIVSEMEAIAPLERRPASPRAAGTTPPAPAPVAADDAWLDRLEL
jgi:hypothetical protein